VRGFVIGLMCFVLAGTAHAGNALENDCRSTFDNPHRWNSGQPKDRYWDARCWDFVEKKDGEWEWVGDGETQRIAKARPQQELEEAERASEEVRQHIGEVKRLWAEKNAAVDLKFETANIKRRWLTKNYEEIGSEKLEKLIRDIRQDVKQLEYEKRRLEDEKARLLAGLKQQVEELAKQQRNWSESLKLSIWRELKQTKSAKLHTGQGSKRVWCFYFRLTDGSFLLETTAVNCRNGRGLGFLEEDDAIEALGELRKELAVLKKRLAVVTEDWLATPKHMSRDLTEIDWRSIANFYLSKLFQSETAADKTQINPLEVLSKSVQKTTALGLKTTDITRAPQDFVFLAEKHSSIRSQSTNWGPGVSGEASAFVVRRVGRRGPYAHLVFQTQAANDFLALLEKREKIAPIALYVIEEEPNREVQVERRSNQNIFQVLAGFQTMSTTYFLVNLTSISPLTGRERLAQRGWGFVIVH